MCTLSPPCVITPSSRRPALEWDGPAVGKKAASRPSQHRIWVERKFYDSIGSRASTPLEAARQRLALVCHELGHDQGAECEECADTRGGQIYRELGIDNDEAAVEMFLTRIQNRGANAAAAAFHAGYLGIKGETPADASMCPGTVDGAGLCKVPGAMGVDSPARGYSAQTRSPARGRSQRAHQASLRAAGLDEGQCDCIHAGAEEHETCAVDHPYASYGACPECGEYATKVCRCTIGEAECSNGHEWHLVDGKVMPGPGDHTMPARGADLKQAWLATYIRRDAATRFPDATVAIDAKSKVGRQLVAAGAVAPLRATYDPAWFSADGSLPILPPVIVDARGYVVSGPAVLVDAPERRGRTVVLGADQFSIATTISDAVPGSLQSFTTNAHPEGETLAQIIADQALAYFPDDPLRYAWVLLVTIAIEAGLGALTNGTLNPAINNAKSGAGGTKLNTNGSVDWGLMQINDRAHADLLALKFPDGTPQWSDARANVGMGAQILAGCRQDYPDDIPSQMLDYQGGKGYVARFPRTADQIASYSQANLELFPTDPDRQQALANSNPAWWKLSLLKTWGAPDVTDDSKWPSDPASTAVTDTGAGFGDGSTPNDLGIGASMGSLFTSIGPAFAASSTSASASISVDDGILKYAKWAIGIAAVALLAYLIIDSHKQSQPQEQFS